MLPGLTAMIGFQGGAATGAAGGLTVTATPSTPAKTEGHSTGPNTITSKSTTALATGGVAPYTYAWSFVSGDAAITPLGPTSAATAFSASLGIDEDKSAVFKVTATDANGATGEASVTVSLHSVDTTH